MKSRQIAALLSATAMALPVAAAATPASATGPCTFTPLLLTAYRINDPWPDSTDEIKLTYGSRVFRANGVKVATTLGGMPTESFTTELHVELWELDTGTWTNPNDFLGSTEITPVDQQNQRWFTLDGASYDLTYRVTCG